VCAANSSCDTFIEAEFARSGWSVLSFIEAASSAGVAAFVNEFMISIQGNPFVIFQIPCLKELPLFKDKA
jgi:hypothetical protein